MNYADIKNSALSELKRLGRFLTHHGGTSPSDTHLAQVMLDYAEMREKANDTYNVAAKAVVGIYINHILSAIDAVWSATSYNKDLAVKFRMQNLQFANRIELIPTVNFQYNF